MFITNCKQPLERRATYRVRVGRSLSKKIENINLVVSIREKKLTKISGGKWCFKVYFNWDNASGLQPKNCLAKLMLWFIRRKIHNFDELLKKIVPPVEKYLYKAIRMTDNSFLKKILQRGIQLGCKSTNPPKIIDNLQDMFFVDAHGYKVKIDKNGRIFVNSKAPLAILKNQLKEKKIKLDEFSIRAKMQTDSTILLNISFKEEGGNLWDAEIEFLVRGDILENIRINIRKNKEDFINLAMLRVE